jgi:hypothetical protein
MLPRQTLSRIAYPPRIPELLFAAVLVWLFATGQGWSVLLADGDAGWHIRNGEQILDSGRVPYTDVFAFGSEGHSWFAWEWLSDVLFAGLFRMCGLKGVSVCCGIVIAATVSILFRHMIERSVGVMIALPVTLLAVGASSIHYLARPHVIGLLFFAVLCRIVDRDRSKPGHTVAGLPLLFLLWTNCHGSFLAGIAMLGLWCIEAAIVMRRFPRRHCTILGGAVMVTFCNPYGWRLHVHAIEYLRSSWIRAFVEEFQSPRFRSENMLQFEILLFAGLLTLAWLLRRKEWYPVLAILLWAHESLASVRHVPLYCVAACPFIASGLQDLWTQLRRGCHANSLFAAFDGVNAAWGPWTRGVTIWPVVLSLAIAVTAAKPINFGATVGFPENKFPVTLVERNAGRFADGTRVFSSDQWSDYLIYRLYPAVRIYFDGRSDYFGPWRGKAYQQLMAGQSEAVSILSRENVRFALIPNDWALAGILRATAGWRVADSDELGVLFMCENTKFAAGPNQNLRVRR